MLLPLDEWTLCIIPSAYDVVNLLFSCCFYLVQGTDFAAPAAAEGGSKVVRSYYIYRSPQGKSGKVVLLQPRHFKAMYFLQR